jgi:hypothetical protein
MSDLIVIAYPTKWRRGALPRAWLMPSWRGWSMSRVWCHPATTTASSDPARPGGRDTPRPGGGMAGGLIGRDLVATSGATRESR